MGPTLDSLPFDVLFDISEYLDVDEVVHLHQTCRQLNQLLQERTFCRRIVKTHCAYTHEASLAQAGKIGYKQALLAISDRRHALSNALPFSVGELGQGDSFLFRQGILCVLDGSKVEVTEVHSTSDPFQIDLPQLVPTLFDKFPNLSVEMMSYSDNILVMHVSHSDRSNSSCIYAIDTERDRTNEERILKAIYLQNSSKLFVRHTAHYLYYGTHTGTGNDGYHKWEIRGVSLSASHPLPSCNRPLLLENFHGTDIGSTIAFEIHDSHFHAVSNQGTYEVEEVDWTSFYHCIRFPLSSPHPDSLQRNPRVYRRQHAQGPIHDSWTNLTLQHCERTNALLIIESRREWTRASSRQSRSFYTTPFTAIPTASPSASASTSASTSEPNNLPSQYTQTWPEDSPLVPLLTSSNNANYMRTPPLPPWHRHPEFPPGTTTTTPTNRTFILARTKYTAYVHASSTFLDVVEDESCCPTAPQPKKCLRLRVGTRRPAPPSLPLGTGLGLDSPSMPNAVPLHANSREAGGGGHGDDGFTYAPLRLWPPRPSCACARAVHGVVNSVCGTEDGDGDNDRVEGDRSVMGVLDGGCFVYLDRSGEGRKGRIVCVWFCRGGRGNIVEVLRRCGCGSDGGVEGKVEKGGCTDGTGKVLGCRGDVDLGGGSFGGGEEGLLRLDGWWDHVDWGEV